MIAIIHLKMNVTGSTHMSLMHWFTLFSCGHLAKRYTRHTSLDLENLHFVSFLVLIMAQDKSMPPHRENTNY